MKNIILISITILLPSFYVFSQWSQISTINTPQLNAVKFFNESTGIVAGVDGIWRSTDSGFNWTHVFSGVNMNAISFPNNNFGYSVGDSGKIYKSVDNGITWLPQTSNITNNLFSVSFFNTTNGFTVGQNGIILRTTNGGSWYQNSNSLTEDLNCVQMIMNTGTAIAVGSVNNEIFTATINGGTNWIYSLNEPDNYLKSLTYLQVSPSGSILTVGSNGRIRKTTNNGGTWSIITSPTNQLLNCVTFVDGNAWIAGNSGMILKSTNNGSNWNIEPSPSGSNLKSISFINLSTGWCVGSNGTVLRTGIPVGIHSIETNIPEEFILFQNYPNPFNPETTIKFVIMKSSHFTLRIFNIRGERVSTLINRELQRGNYELKFPPAEESNKFSSGIYYCILSNDAINVIKKMVLLK